MVPIRLVAVNRVRRTAQEVFQPATDSCDHLTRRRRDGNRPLPTGLARIGGLRGDDPRTEVAAALHPYPDHQGTVSVVQVHRRSRRPCRAAQTPGRAFADPGGPTGSCLVTVGQDSPPSEDPDGVTTGFDGRCRPTFSGPPKHGTWSSVA